VGQGGGHGRLLVREHGQAFAVGPVDRVQRLLGSSSKPWTLDEGTLARISAAFTGRT